MEASVRIGMMLRHFGQPGGIGMYTRNIIAALLKMDQRNQYLLCYRYPEQLGGYSRYPNVQEFVVQAPNKLWWDQIAIPRLAEREHLDLIFNPKLSVPLFTKCKTTFVMHGAEQFAVPYGFKWHDRMYFTIAERMYCKKADAIIVMTHTGSKDIAHYVGADPNKLRVIPESYNELCQVLDEEQALRIREKHRLPERYILFIGGLNPIKNLKNILKAYHKICHSFPHKLVVVGFRRWKYSEDLHLISELGLRDRVFFTGFVPDEDISAVYNLADVFVFPSLYEGFGMPVLEAMACGCPVITTDKGCSPEVGGGAAILVNPYDPQQIADAIEKVLTDNELRERLIAKGLIRASEFSWDKCARETLELFESL